MQVKTFDENEVIALQMCWIEWYIMCMWHGGIQKKEDGGWGGGGGGVDGGCNAVLGEFPTFIIWL